MDNPNNGSSRSPLHPLVAAAAIAVIALSAVGITAFVMNRSSATPSPYDAPPVAVAPIAPAPANEPAPAPRVATAPNYAAPSKPVYDSPPPQPRYDAPAQVAVAPTCHDCGTIEAIHDIKVKGQGTGVGAVGGAVVGGLLGNMVGAGRGKALATVAGAVGGGFGGNAIEKNVRGETEYQTIVRLDDGGTRTFTQVNPPPYGVGERVRIRDGHLERG